MQGENVPVVLTIDLQHDFFDESAAGAGVGHFSKAFALPGARRLLAESRARGWCVVHVKTVHTGHDTLPLHHKRSGTRPYCVKGSHGVGIVDGLYQPGDNILEKQFYSAFAGTDLDSLVANTDIVIVAGIAADCCVLATALDASTTHGKRVYLPYDAISASTAEAYSVGLVSASKSAGAVVRVDGLQNLDHAWENRKSPNTIRNECVQWFREREAILQTISETSRKDSETSSVLELDHLETQLRALDPSAET